MSRPALHVKALGEQPENGRARGARTRPAISIVIPTRNEAGNIDRLLAELERVLPGEAKEIIFVDDSSDETPEVIEAARGRRDSGIVLIHRTGEERADGLGGAVVRGMRSARAPWVCVMDADLQHPPEIIDRLLSAARDQGLDLVIASRYCAAGAASSFGVLRAALSRASTTAAKLLFPRALHGVSDPMTGFFLVRVGALDLDQLDPRGFKILLEILIRRPGLRSAEVPFTFGTRHAGKSKASLGEGVTYLGRLLELRWGERPLRFAQFLLVGGSGLVVNVAAFAAFARLGGLHYLIAAVLATQVSTLWNFVLAERWVFSARREARSATSRLALFWAMNNVALALRGPMLVVLVSSLYLDAVLANLLTLLSLTILRFGLADTWIWGRAGRKARGPALHCYRIHGLVTVESPVALPELERFRVDRLTERPSIRIRLGTLSRMQSELVSAMAFIARHIRYDEGLGRFGFGVEISIGRCTEILASPLLAYSPHVLYTNVVEPVLRWAFVKKGYVLAHAACIAFGDDAYLITARTDTGKTTTILRTLDRHPCRFLSDDLTLIRPDGNALMYPKPLTISRHTMHAVRTPLLSRRERLALFFQSRLHSRSGRQFALLLAKSHLPVATINAIIQLLVPPPKYHIERLVPHAQVAREAHVAGFFLIERGGTGEVRLHHEEAVETLIRNTDDAYGFPPYPYLEHFLHSGNGRNLRAEERAIISGALDGVTAIRLRSETMDWWERIPALTNGGAAHLAFERPEPETFDGAIPIAVD